MKYALIKTLTLIHKMPEWTGSVTEWGRAVREKQMGPKRGSTSSFRGKTETLVVVTEEAEKFKKVL